MRRATFEDIPLLVGFMEEFYAEAGFELHHARAASAFATLLGDERLGYVWIIQEGLHEVCHLVVALRYAMEYGGLIACVDDLYVRPRSRNKGLSKAALIELRGFCECNGIRAMTVEVGHGNDPAQAGSSGLTSPHRRSDYCAWRPRTAWSAVARRNGLSQRGRTREADRTKDGGACGPDLAAGTLSVSHGVPRDHLVIARDAPASLSRGRTESRSAGFRHILFLNSHAGNQHLCVPGSAFSYQRETFSFPKSRKNG